MARDRPIKAYQEAHPGMSYYQARIEVGRLRGLTPSQAIGKPKPGEVPVSTLRPKVEVSERWLRRQEMAREAGFASYSEMERLRREFALRLAGVPYSQMSEEQKEAYRVGILFLHRTKGMAFVKGEPKLTPEDKAIITQYFPEGSPDYWRIMRALYKKPRTE